MHVPVVGVEVRPGEVGPGDRGDGRRRNRRPNRASPACCSSTRYQPSAADGPAADRLAGRHREAVVGDVRTQAAAERWQPDRRPGPAGRRHWRPPAPGRPPSRGTAGSARCGAGTRCRPPLVTCLPRLRVGGQPAMSPMSGVTVPLSRTSQNCRNAVAFGSVGSPRQASSRASSALAPSRNEATNSASGVRRTTASSGTPDSPGSSSSGLSAASSGASGCANRTAGRSCSSGSAEVRAGGTWARSSTRAFGRRRAGRPPSGCRPAARPS